MLYVLCSEKYEEVMREIELEALERATMEASKQKFYIDKTMEIVYCVLCCVCVVL